MQAGDLAPTFSNNYPWELGPWVSEQQFRILLREVNEGLTAAFDPFSRRNVLDSVLGLATGWLWESVFAQTAVKKKVREVERKIEEWNMQLEKEARLGGRSGSIDGSADVACCIPLSRTGFLSLDIQIPIQVLESAGQDQGEGKASNGEAHKEDKND